MLFNTARFGEIQLEEEKTVLFPQGLPGFEQMRRFILLHAEEGIPFSFLQSLEDGDLAFIVTDPFLFFPDYQFDLPESVLAEMELKEEKDVMIFSIVSVDPSSQQITLNLLAPLVLNIQSKRGKQIILHQTPYKTKHPIELKRDPVEKEV